MKVVARIAEVRGAVGEARRAGRRIAFVPTMGALHAGHLALVERAHANGAYVVMSIFVNPLQFGPSEDFTRYPRDAEGDSARARRAGTDLLFMPSTDDMYRGPMAAVVVPRVATDLWEGKVRPGHFEGVLTVVAKLFNIVQPDVAVFGQKDIQQATLIAAMVRSLDFPVEVDVAPTVREADGLALSSRNVYLSAEDRVQALTLSRALRAVEAEWRGGVTDARALERTGQRVLAEASGVVPDYFAVVNPVDLAPAARAEAGSIVITAARVGRTRLIDNVILRPDGADTPVQGTSGASSAATRHPAASQR